MDEAMMTGQRLPWHPISTVPRNTRVELRTSDAFGPYRLGFPCVLAEEGWINAELQTKLDIVPTEWRQWPRALGDGMAVHESLFPQRSSAHR
jgi:hypothetical protein